MRLYHGTTYENYEGIMKYGFKPRPDSAWRCSNCNYMFFYTDTRKTKEECFKDCISNALYTAIFNNFQGTALVILEMEVPDEYVIEDPTVDPLWNECVQKSVAVHCSKLDKSMIRQVYVNPEAYNKHLRWWYFANKHENGCCNFDNTQKDLWEAICVMAETVNIERKQEYLQTVLYNIKKYIPIWDSLQGDSYGRNSLEK